MIMNRSSCLRLPGAFRLAAVVMFLSPLWAADVSDVVASRITSMIQVDGVLDEPAWQANPSISNLVQVEPRPGEPPTEATQVWVAYNKDLLYIGTSEKRQPRHPEISAFPYGGQEDRQAHFKKMESFVVYGLTALRTSQKYQAISAKNTVTAQEKYVFSIGEPSPCCGGEIFAGVGKPPRTWCSASCERGGDHWPERKERIIETR